MEMHKVANTILTNQLGLYLVMARNSHHRSPPKEAIDILVTELNDGLDEVVFRVENEMIIMETQGVQVFVGGFNIEGKFGVVTIPQITPDVLESVSNMLQNSITVLFLRDRIESAKKEVSTIAARQTLAEDILAIATR